MRHVGNAITHCVHWAPLPSLNISHSHACTHSHIIIIKIHTNAHSLLTPQGSDIVMRILHKKELGCCATSAAVLKEEDSSVNANTRKDNAFWEVLGGKKAVKSESKIIVFHTKLRVSNVQAFA